MTYAKQHNYTIKLINMILGVLSKIRDDSIKDDTAGSRTVSIRRKLFTPVTGYIATEHPRRTVYRDVKIKR